jgi:hypothetical protein
MTGSSGCRAKLLTRKVRTEGWTNESKVLARPMWIDVGFKGDHRVERGRWLAPKEGGCCGQLRASGEKPSPKDDPRGCKSQLYGDSMGRMGLAKR